MHTKTENVINDVLTNFDTLAVRFTSPCLWQIYLAENTLEAHLQWEYSIEPYWWASEWKHHFSDLAGQKL